MGYWAHVSLLLAFSQIPLPRRTALGEGSLAWRRMSRKRNAEALVRQVFGSDGDSSDGSTPSTSECDFPPPVPFLAPDRERHVGPLADSIPGLHLARGAFTREAQAWLLDAIRKEGLVETPDPPPEIFVASRVAREAPSHAYEARTTPRSVHDSTPQLKPRATARDANRGDTNPRTRTSFRKNQAMRFGNFPPWAAVLAERVARVAAEDRAFPASTLLRRESRSRLFDQFIVNAYAPGEGLKPHVDLAAFDDGVCVVSLLSSTVMDLSPAEGAAEGARKQRRRVASSPSANETRRQRARLSAAVPSRANAESAENASESGFSIGIRLDPGDALFLSGDARWRWRHGIAARAADERTVGGACARGFRVSVTLRRLREEGRELRVAANAREDGGGEDDGAAARCS